MREISGTKNEKPTIKMAIRTDYVKSPEFAKKWKDIIDAGRRIIIFRNYFTDSSHWYCRFEVGDINNANKYLCYLKKVTDIYGERYLVERPDKGFGYCYVEKHISEQIIEFIIKYYESIVFIEIGSSTIRFICTADKKHKKSFISLEHIEESGYYINNDLNSKTFYINYRNVLSPPLDLSGILDEIAFAKPLIKKYVVKTIFDALEEKVLEN